jgi:hypothetical protein
MFPPAVSSDLIPPGREGCVEAARDAGGGVGVAVLLLGEGKVGFDSFHIRAGNSGGLPQRAFPLAALLLKNVACPLFPAQNLPRASHFESFCDCLSGLGFS